MEPVSWATLVVAIIVLAIGLDNALVNYQNNQVLKSQVDSLVQSQQKLLSTTYLATSSNNLLIENQKQFVPAIPTIHSTLAHVEKMLNETGPIILKLGQVENQSNNHR